MHTPSRRPDPTRRRLSDIAARHEPSPRQPEPMPPHRLPPKTVDFLNSAPEHGNPFPSLREPLEPVELEICDASLGSYSGADANSLQNSATSSASESRSVTPVGGAGGRMVTASVSNGTAAADILIRLPRRWKVARDCEGRVYYYHTHSRVPQWEPPTVDQMAEEEEHQGTEYSSREEVKEDIEMETNTSDEDGEDEEESDEEEKEEGVEGAEPEEPIEEGVLTQDQDLSASEKKMLIRIRDRSRVSKEERSNLRKVKRRRERQRREQEREFTQARYERHRDTGLVEEHCVPRDRSNSSTFREIRERLLHKEEVLREIDKEIREDDRREIMERQDQDKLKRDIKKAEKQRREAELHAAADTVAAPAHRQATATKTTTAAADTSSDAEKKVKDRFVKEMSSVIVKTLDPYRNPKSKGHISTNDDFKYLAKKLTYLIYEKEKARVRSVEDLKITEKMKAKAAEYVKKKMNSYDEEYKRSPHK